jgi:hypothetical protein
MEHFDLTERNLITEEVEVDLDVLRALMLHWLAGHVYNTDVVTENHCGLPKWGMQLQQELRSQEALTTALATARYSASALERETIACCLEDQEIRLALRNTAYPDVDLRVSGQPAQSASE